MKSKFNNYLSENEKDLILKMYNNGYNTVTIAKELNRNNSSIGRYLKKIGLKATYSKCELSDDEKQKIREMYKEGCTARQILLLYSSKISTENTIMSVVKEVNINRKRGVPSHCNEDYFSSIDTESKAYFLGLFLTDGNVHLLNRNTEQYVVQIALKNEDFYILEKFKKEIESSNIVRNYCKNNRNEALFAVSSLKMAQDLKRWGVYPNKTFSAELNYNIPKNLFRHYIRGIFDGDGTVFISKGYVKYGFYGTHQLVNQVQQWLIKEIGISCNKVFDKDTVSFVTYQKKNDVKNFYHLIYDNANVYLTRKKQKFEEGIHLYKDNTEVTN